MNFPFFGQLFSFYGLAITFAQIKKNRTSAEINQLINELNNLPPLLKKLVNDHNKISEKLAHDFSDI